MGRVKWMTVGAVSLAASSLVSAAITNFAWSYACGLAAITFAILSQNE